MSREVPIERKFGYAWLVEIRALEDAIRSEGEADDALIFFEARRRYEERHRNDPTYREKSAAILARAKAAPSLLDRYRLALQEIRDGHNDPRRLAREVLSDESP